MAEIPKCAIGGWGIYGKDAKDLLTVHDTRNLGLSAKKNNMKTAYL